MALTPEQIDAINTRTLGHQHFARAIEAEVCKDYDALIRQMLEALQSSRVLKADYGSLESYGVANRKHDAAIAAARARLEKAP